MKGLHFMGITKTFQRVTISLVATAGFTFAGTAFSQTVLNPGDSATTGLGVFDSHSAFIDNTFDPSVLAAPPTFGGTMGSWVDATNPNNPFGGLTFVYQFFNNWSSADGIHRLTVDGFDGFKTAVAYSTYWTGDAVDGINRSGSGDNIGVSWLDGVAPGSFGNLMVYTDATQYGMHTAFLQDGSQVTVSVFAPIPEPETYAMLIAGLGLMGFVVRRRKQIQS